MRLRNLAWATVLVAGLGLGSRLQDQQPEHDQQRQQEQPKQSPQRPSLGTPTEPSLNGPRTSTTTDPRKLAKVRSIYVERIDNLLSDRLAEGLVKMGRFRVTASRNEADAVLRGTCFDSRRLKSVHSEVYLSDRGGASIWQDDVRRPFNPPPLAKVVDTTAAAILQHLGDSVREAERRP